jgi:serine/threonine-protein kinase
MAQPLRRRNCSLTSSRTTLPPHCGSLIIPPGPTGDADGQLGVASTGTPDVSLFPSAIGQYQIVRPLGSGGMGAVYLALDTKLDRHVAIKILHTALDSPENRERLLREARLAAKLQHRNIVTIHAVDDYDGLPYIVMEYVVGDTLAAMIRERMPLGLVRRLDLIDEVCAGLVHAWKRAGLVHRDVKPSNLMVDREEVVRILDFGIARATQAGAISGTAVAGTPAYMSPEQIENGRIDHRSDVFSVGVVLYELLTYRRAFQGDSHAAVFRQVLRYEPVPLLECDPCLEPDLVQIVARAICKDPNDRYQDLQQLRDDLAPIRRRLARSQRADTTGLPYLASPVPTTPASPGSGRQGSGGAEPFARAAGPAPDVVVSEATPPGLAAAPVLDPRALPHEPGSASGDRPAPGWLEARRPLEHGELELANGVMEPAHLRGGPTPHREMDDRLRSGPEELDGTGSYVNDAPGVELQIRPGEVFGLDVAIPRTPYPGASDSTRRVFPWFPLLLAGLLVGGGRDGCLVAQRPARGAGAPADRVAAGKCSCATPRSARSRAPRRSRSRRRDGSGGWPRWTMDHASRRPDSSALHAARADFRRRTAATVANADRSRRTFGHPARLARRCTARAHYGGTERAVRVRRARRREGDLCKPHIAPSRAA